MAGHHRAITAPKVRIAVHHIAARVSSGNCFTDEDVDLGGEEGLAATGRASSVMTLTSRRPVTMLLIGALDETRSSSRIVIAIRRGYRRRDWCAGINLSTWKAPA